MGESLGADALAIGICALHVTYRFEHGPNAKAAWERLAKRCHHLSINRVMDPGATAQFVVAACEDQPAMVHEFAKAKRLLAAAAGGELVETPDYILEVTAAKRARLYFSPDTKTLNRTPLGDLVDTDGVSLGPYRRPQG